MIRKPFENSEYSENDGRGKSAAKQLIEDLYGYSVIINDEDFGADLTVKLFKSVIDVEVLVKKAWVENEWSKHWRWVDLEQRRKKMRPRETMFFVLNGILTRAWFIHDRSLKDDRLFTKKTNKDFLTGGNELFYAIPLAECRWLSKDEDDWKQKGWIYGQIST